MCGIVFLLADRPQPAGSAARCQCEAQVRDGMARIRHRGPDWSGQWTSDDGRLFAGHERLAIVAPQSGRQPIVSNTTVLIVNGEIYNHQKFLQSVDTVQTSDCTAIVHAYAQFDKDARRACAALDGDFAFVLLDLERRVVVVARDRMGVCPLYTAETFNNENGRAQRWFVSEFKALPSNAANVCQFPPGHVAVIPFECAGCSIDAVPYDSEPVYGVETRFSKHVDVSVDDVLTNLRASLENAVTKRLMADVPIGVLLSGGLDSSLVAAIAVRHFEQEKWGRLKTFSIGLKGSPDLEAARSVAEFLGTDHHEFHFTVQDGLRALSDAIWHLETYDVTTIRAGTPMYLLARLVKSFGVKCVLSGEGADEAMAGYLYFHRAPSAAELHAETVRKLARLHHYDVLRANKAMSAGGVEVRVPFLDADFLRVAMQQTPPFFKMVAKDDNNYCEKWLLRMAFEGYLPNDVLWRRKEQFSDGVGYDWIGSLRRMGDASVSDDELASNCHEFQPPMTKEAFLYRSMFNEVFQSTFASREAAERAVRTEPMTIACSTATALAWDAAWHDCTEPSGLAAVNT